MSMTDELLRELHDLCVEASPPPWDDGGDGVLFGTSADASGVWLPQDAAFVSRARTALPELLAIVKQLLYEKRRASDLIIDAEHEIKRFRERAITAENALEKMVFSK